MLAPPGSHALDLHLQREAEGRSYQHNDSEYAHVLECRAYGHRAQQIRGDEDFQAQQQRPAEALAQQAASVGGRWHSTGR